MVIIAMLGLECMVCVGAGSCRYVKALLVASSGIRFISCRLRGHGFFRQSPGEDQGVQELGLEDTIRTEFDARRIMNLSLMEGVYPCVRVGLDWRR